MTYKLVPGHESKTSIETVYGSEHAHRVVAASIADYEDEYGG